MTRVVAFVCVSVLALAPATAREAPLPEARATKQPVPLLGLVQKERGATLVRVDRRSLQPVPRPRLSLFGAGPWAYSPDRRTLAVVGPCQAGRGLSDGITFVDVAHVHSAGCMWLSGISALRWPQARRLVAVTGEVVTIEPVRRRVLERSPLPVGQVLGVARAGSGLVLLVSTGGLGRLVVVDEQGSVRSVALDIPAGIQPRTAMLVQPGLAVDSAGTHAFVVPSAGLVADVSLETLTVQYRDLRQNVSFLRRLAAWLEPAADAKELPSSSRSAVWLGNGMVAVAGSERSGDRPEPSGLALVDTRTWSTRSIDSRVDSITVSGGRIVATGPHAGLAVYDLSGTVLYRRFEGWTARVSVVYGGRIYTTLSGELRTRVLALASGRQLAVRTDVLPRLLLESSG